MNALRQVLLGSPYQAYLYSYPHKTSYRRLEPAIDLAELWSGEQRDALFLYFHVPFCEMRCGFCNLFTTARVQDGAVTRYLDTLEKQVEAVAGALPDTAWARLAIGGGTPTFLEPAELERLLGFAERLGLDGQRVPGSVESSPETITPERVKLLSDFGLDRISIGIQSFVPDECKSLARPQRAAQVHAALDVIRSVEFRALNIDLMYGIGGQTEASFQVSLDEALRYKPEEIYLYPLYVRPLTGLGLRGKSWDDMRLELYRFGRAYLLENGYTQVSMRMFRADHADTEDGPVYCCQEDGMVGLGAGARSYTEHLHYSTEYAVSSGGVLEILDAYNARDLDSFRVADYGVRLDDEDRRRRYVILSLLSLADGLDLKAYAMRFGTDAFDDLPQLKELEPAGLARLDGAVLSLTPLGVERSDAIGPWLHSARVRTLMEEYQLR